MDNSEKFRNFLNLLRGLYFIDRHQLPELDDAEWQSFRHDPPSFLIRASDAKADAIWRELTKRNGV